MIWEKICDGSPLRLLSPCGYSGESIKNSLHVVLAQHDPTIVDTTMSLHKDKPSARLEWLPKAWWLKYRPMFALLVTPHRKGLQTYAAHSSVNSSHKQPSGFHLRPPSHLHSPDYLHSKTQNRYISINVYRTIVTTSVTKLNFRYRPMPHKLWQINNYNFYKTIVTESVTTNRIHLKLDSYFLMRDKDTTSITYRFML